MSIRCWRIFSSLLKTDPGKNLISQFEQDKRVEHLKGKMISSGSGGGQFELERLAMWYLWLLNRSDKATADAALEEFLKSERINVVSLVGMEGIMVKSRIQLANNVHLISVSDLPECDLKDTLLRTQFPSQFTRGASPVGGFVAGVSSVPKIVDLLDPERELEDLKGFFDWVQDAYDAVLLLNCLPGIAAIPSFQTAVVNDEIPFGPFNGSGAGTFVHGRSATRSFPCDNLDAAMFADLFSAFQKQSINQKNAWRRALTRLAYAKTALDPSDEALELGIALEMMLQRDNSNREQLSLAFRLRGSWLVEPSDSERRRKAYDTFKFAYSCRSEVAHGGVLAEKNRKRFEEEQEEIFAISERVAQTLLLQPPSDWDAVVLSC